MAKTHDERHVDVPAAPIVDLSAELIERFGPKIQSDQPDIHSERGRIQLDAAPIVEDVRTLGPQVPQGDNFPGDQP